MGEMSIEERISQLCQKVGYGRVIHTASRLWQGLEGADGISAHVVGPANGLTVPCGCTPNNRCDWCCGCGWLTARAKAAKDREEPPVEQAEPEPPTHLPHELYLAHALDCGCFVCKALK